MRAGPRTKNPEDPFLADLIDRLAAQRNQVAAQAKQLNGQLSEKNRELRKLEQALNALRGVK